MRRIGPRGELESWIPIFSAHKFQNFSFSKWIHMFEQREGRNKWYFWSSKIAFSKIYFSNMQFSALDNSIFQENSHFLRPWEGFWHSSLLCTGPPLADFLYKKFVFTREKTVKFSTYISWICQNTHFFTHDLRNFAQFSSSFRKILENFSPKVNSSCDTGNKYFNIAKLVQSPCIFCSLFWRAKRCKILIFPQ